MSPQARLIALPMLTLAAACAPECGSGFSRELFLAIPRGPTEGARG